MRVSLSLIWAPTNSPTAATPHPRLPPATLRPTHPPIHQLIHPATLRRILQRTRPPLRPPQGRLRRPCALQRITPTAPAPERPSCLVPSALTAWVAMTA